MNTKTMPPTKHFTVISNFIGTCKIEACFKKANKHTCENKSDKYMHNTLHK